VQRIKIVCTLLCDAKVTFNPEEMEPLSQVFCFKSKLSLNPEKTESFLLHIYHMSFVRKSKAILSPQRYSIMEFQGVWKVMVMIIN
jgi:hypothetical protein